MKRKLLLSLVMLVLSAVVIAQPATPSTPTVSSNVCGPKILTRANPPVGVVFYWQGTSCAALTTNSAATYTANLTGTYYLRAYEAGSWSTCASVSVTVNPVPAVPVVPAVSTNLCGPKVLTRGIPPSGTTYYWQGTACGTDTTQYALTYAATTTGTFYIAAYTTTGGCWSACNSVVVTYYPNVVTSISWLGTWYYDNDAPVTMLGLPAGGTFSGPGVAGNVFSPAVAGVGNHVIVYEYTDGNGCYDSIHHPLHVEHWTGIADNAYDRFVSVYPNPVNDLLNVKIDALQDEVISYSVISLTGNQVDGGSFINRNNQQIDVSKLSNGVYYIRLRTSQMNVHKKIVISR